jgi:osmotically inducible lipoprotein OsmB
MPILWPFYLQMIVGNGTFTKVILRLGILIRIYVHNERSFMISTKTISLAVLALMLAACGNTQKDRALSGAGIGAGVGAVGGAVAGGHPVTGAVLGGAAGAATGAFTDEEDINLGKPAWK